MSGSLAGAEMITFLAPASRCFCGVLPLREQAGGLDHDLHSEVAPGECGRVLLVQHPDLGAIDLDAAVGDLDLAREAPEDRVVLEQVGDHLGVDQVVDRDELEIRARLVRRAEQVPADAPEAVDAHLDCHWKSS